MSIDVVVLFFRFPIRNCWCSVSERIVVVSILSAELPAVTSPNARLSESPTGYVHSSQSPSVQDQFHRAQKNMKAVSLLVTVLYREFGPACSNKNNKNQRKHWTSKRLYQQQQSIYLHSSFQSKSRSVDDSKKESTLARKPGNPWICSLKNLKNDTDAMLTNSNGRLINL